MENLIKGMSLEDLQLARKTYGEKYPDLIKDIDTEIANRKALAKAEEVKAKFVGMIESIFANPKKPLPHPEDIANIYVRWAEVEEETGEAEVEVEIADDKGVKSKVMRKPMRKVFKWVVEVNKAFNPVKTTNTTFGNGTRKRAISVKHIEGDKLVTIGNFRTAKEACGYLKLDVGADSANRVLTTFKYLTEPYDGHDFIVSA